MDISLTLLSTTTHPALLIYAKDQFCSNVPFERDFSRLKKDVFVILAEQKGMITGMTRDTTEWLVFPLQALNKDISLKQIFDRIPDDECCEKRLARRQKIDFFMNSFKNAP